MLRKTTWDEIRWSVYNTIIFRLSPISYRLIPCVLDLYNINDQVHQTLAYALVSMGTPTYSTTKPGFNGSAETGIIMHLNQSIIFIDSGQKCSHN